MSKVQRAFLMVVGLVGVGSPWPVLWHQARGSDWRQLLEVRFTLRQSVRAPHIGTYGRARVFRRSPHDVTHAVAGAGLTVGEDLEFKAYLGLIHHLVVARAA